MVRKELSHTCCKYSCIYPMASPQRPDHQPDCVCCVLEPKLLSDRRSTGNNVQHLICCLTFTVDTDHHPLANSGCLGRLVGGKKQATGAVNRSEKLN